MNFNVKWSVSILRAAIVGTAIAVGALASAGTSSMTDHGPTTALERAAVAEASAPATFRQITRKVKETALREMARTVTSVRVKGLWHVQAQKLASGATATIVTVASARIRTRPVNGTITGLIPLDEWFFVQCQRRAGDGQVWGNGHYNGRWGWVRDDLWDVIYTTAPGGSAPRPIPWC